MKKVCCTILIGVIILVLAAGLFACGGATNDKAITATLILQKENYRLNRINVDGVAIGVRMCGGFFGLDDIDVYADLYYGSGEGVDGGTTPSEEKLIDIAEQIAQIATDVNLSCNTLLDGKDGAAMSDVWRYNNADGGTKIEVTESTYEMFVLSKEMYDVTDGLFNPALFRAVDLWGFSARFADGVYKKHPQNYDRVFDYENNSYPLPEEKFVAAFVDKDFVRFDDVTESADGRYFVTKSDAVAVVDGVSYARMIDFGGVAKGYVCDKADELLADNGIEHYYVSVGSSSSTCGTDRDGKQFDVAVVNPFEPTTSACDIAVQNSGVSSGGLYNRNYTTEGKTYAHIIDGTNGRPTTSGVYGVTLITPDEQFSLSKADSLTTALSQMSAEQIAEFVNGYADKNGWTVIAFVKTTDGRKQVLTNAEGLKLSESADDIAVALKKDGDVYVYDGDSMSNADKSAVTKVVVVVALCAIFVCLIGVTVALCITNRNVRKDIVFKNQPLFKRADIYVYFVLATLVVVLFALFARPVTHIASTVVAADTDSGKTIFAYDIATGKWQVYQTEGIDCEVNEDGNTLIVTVRRIDNPDKFNTFEIAPTADGVKVKMVDAECGIRKDCIRVFGEVTSTGSIVCSPNRLKITVE